MALLLAPYNDAMRLGMGFNTFTQQLCVNDAVQLPGGIKASEKDLITSSAADTKGQPAPGVPKYNPSGEVTRYGHPKTTGGTVVRKHKDGSQADISQIVTWKSTFVNNISEVTENMNIKGSLAIKIDAIGGGAKAQANYLNTESFKKSDINYHLQVDVVNQRLVGENITEFMPIKNVQPNQFQDVYGDGFISGFLEGGVFNAIISIELANKDEVKDFGGELSIKAKFAGGAVQVEGEGSGSKKTTNKSTNDKITVSVSWSGGGDIITEEVEKFGWNMDTLKQVAMSFADKVALCPQKTNAILTKYSSLRSFYEKSLHGSPLDYENAGVYSSALLDAYMDYKAAWKELQVMSYEVNNALAILKKADDQPEIKDMAEDADNNYKEQLKQYAAAQESKDSSEETSLVKHNPANASRVSKPLPPNKLNLYAPSVYGLDQAQRDCRFEMIKIVREVDAVAEDPQVAVDPTRNNQFLSPVVFRQLLPSARKVDPVKMEQEIASLKTQLETERQSVIDLTLKKEELSAQLSSTQSELQTTTEDRNLVGVKLQGAESRADVLAAQLRDSEELVQTITRESSAKISNLEGSNAELTVDLLKTRGDLDIANSTNKTLNDRVKAFEDEGGEKTAAMSKMVAEREASIVDLKRELDQERTSKMDAVSNLQTKLAGAEQREGENASELSKSITRVQALETDNRNLNDRIQALDTAVNQQRTELEAEQRRVASLTSERDSLQNQASPSWDIKNNLDSGFHGRTVQILNMFTMDSGGGGYALDMGRDNGTRPHAIPFHIGNGWQKLRLEKVNPASRTSDWYILCGTYYLYCQNDGVSLMCDPSPSLQNGCCRWWIKKIDSNRGYVIENLQYGCLHLEYAGDGPAGSANNQTWAIMGV
ncbi:hypothetical protein F66182_3094 [Fusarium sp. NRRL 66182]|nr:hypothetical protein F66182_3094 [Fusarium sp. NRRL 66182]